MGKFTGFEPLVDNDSEILILGSFPSVISRTNNFYYGNPQNRFWKMLATIFNENLPQSIENKKELCRKHKIALWDVVISSNLSGSSDVSLEKSNIELADINELLKRYPSIKTILCNGKLAYNLFNKYFKVELPVFYMPSTSPANVSYNIDNWREKLTQKPQ